MLCLVLWVFGSGGTVEVFFLCRTSSRPSGSVPSAPSTSLFAETSLGVSLPGSSSSSLPLGGQGKRGGSRGAPSVLWGASSPPARLWSGERGGSASGHLSVACGLAPSSPPPSGGGGAGVGSLAADALFPLLLVCWLSPILTARSTTWEFEGVFSLLLPRFILPQVTLCRAWLEGG